MTTDPSLDLATLETRLQEAEDALHRWRIGEHELSITYAGRTLTYSPTNEVTLKAYISELRGKLGLPVRSRKPIRPRF